MLGHLLPTVAWAVGKWWYTFQRQNDLVFAKGYWSTIYARDGDAWKIRMSTFNQPQHQRGHGALANHGFEAR